MSTVCAVATPAGSGGVGIVRVSGPAALAVAGRLVRREPATFEDRRMELCVAWDPGSGERLDDVLVVVMRGPRSYTGEDVAEIHGHGGAVNMRRLLRATLACGAEMAGPGEFTRRAFASGRLDLTRAEAVAAVIGAASERALRVAQAQLAGSLGRRARELSDGVTALLAEVEASIDFPEEDLDLMAPGTVAERADAWAKEAEALAATYATGKALTHGVVVALVGPPNVGKSSLLNALVGEERAVVADEPGTTRDFVEATVVWDGVPVTLVDTAGEREASSEAERRGIELGRARAGRADVVVRLRDVTAPGDAGDDADGPNALVVWNKVDVAPGPAGALGVSALRGDGIDALREAVLARVVSDSGEEGEVLTSERQRARVAEAAAAARRAAEAARRSAPAEIVALELRAAADAVAGLIGVDVEEAVLDELFARFCIGK